MSQQALARLALVACWTLWLEMVLTLAAACAFCPALGQLHPQAMPVCSPQLQVLALERSVWHLGQASNGVVP